MIDKWNHPPTNGVPGHPECDIYDKITVYLVEKLTDLCSNLVLRAIGSVFVFIRVGWESWQAC